MGAALKGSSSDLDDLKAPSLFGIKKVAFVVWAGRRLVQMALG
jgi:hypothetical protein